jgi:RecJ-like exonuclease
MTVRRFIDHLSYTDGQRPETINVDRWKAMCKSFEGAVKEFGSLQCPDCPGTGWINAWDKCRTCRGRGIRI